MPRPRTETRAAVLIVHTTPDGAAHIDWMIERSRSRPGAPSPAHRLRTHRVVVRIERPTPGRFLARPVPDHRDAYLDYEGPLTGDRGRVDRLVRGVVLEHSDAIAVIRWRADATVRYVFGPESGGFRRVLADPIME